MFNDDSAIEVMKKYIRAVRRTVPEGQQRK